MEKDGRNSEPAIDDYKDIVIDDTIYITSVTKKFKLRKPYIPADPKRLLCTIPGIVRSIHIKQGQQIKTWDRLLVIEAMKMENEILSTTNGRVKAIHIKSGEMVTKGQLLAEFD